MPKSFPPDVRPRPTVRLICCYGVLWNPVLRLHAQRLLHAEPNQARVNVPDERFDWLVSNLYKPKVRPGSRNRLRVFVRGTCISR